MKMFFLASFFVFQFFSYSAWSSTHTLTKIKAPNLIDKIKSQKNLAIVNLWATWCEPCKEEFPVFTKLQKDDKQISLYLVSMDFISQEAAVREFLKGQKVAFETYWREGSDSEFIEALLPKWSGALPVTAFFDQNGKLLKMIQGKISHQKLASEINQLKKQKEKK